MGPYGIGLTTDKNKLTLSVRKGDLPECSLIVNYYSAAIFPDFSYISKA